MVYNHVARAIEPDFNGMENSFPATVNMGETHSQEFTFVLPATWNTDHMHIVGLLFDPSGMVDNAGKIDFSEVDVVEELFFQCPDPVTLYAATDGNLMPDFHDSIVNAATTCTTPDNTVTYIQSPVAGTTLSNGVNAVTFTASDNCGITTQCTFNVTFVNNAAIGEVESNTVSFFPNPASESVRFSAKGKICTVSLIGIDGKVVSSKAVNASEGELSLSGLNSGLYILEFSLDNGSKSAQQLVKN